jgi:hypothetical protein
MKAQESGRSIFYDEKDAVSPRAPQTISTLL